MNAITQFLAGSVFHPEATKAMSAAFDFAVSLIQSLQKQRIYADQHHGKLEGDKIMRLTAQAAHFHAGAVYFREDAPWLDELMAELLGFPGVRHDDQVNSISQALAFVSWQESHYCSSEELRF